MDEENPLPSPDLNFTREVQSLLNGDSVSTSPPHLPTVPTDITGDINPTTSTSVDPIPEDGMDIDNNEDEGQGQQHNFINTFFNMGM
ncbi:MAG: hypothetical protein MJE68_32440, partial [Proteobacteria bacterium]|nr:hypothetical protein [Pseudomonadota bacterium]